LGVFRGIAGILSSTGEYNGVLERIETDGITDTPDFRLRRAGHPVHLKTKFHAIVDGTDGDTYLEPVEARFLNSILVARGKAEGKKGAPGKTITLDITADHARVEDLLQLALAEPAPMTGPVRLKTRFRLPHGQQEIPDRLNLDGTFNLASVHFRSNAVQQSFDNLSKRSLGHAGDVKNTDNPDKTDDVASAMKGRFQLANGILELSAVQFQVPGASVKLDGTYNLDQELLDLHGHLEMQAKLSQTTTGIKSFILKAVDPFFLKDGKGAVLPIKITGSIKRPTYGLDLHHKEVAKTPASHP
jgi:AsmA-like protein